MNEPGVPMDLILLWAIQLLPIAAFLIGQLLPKPLKKTAPGLSVTFAFAAAVASSLLWFRNAGGAALPREFSFAWLSVSEGPILAGWPASGPYGLEAGFLLDRMNLLMVWLVTVIHFFVQLFSLYYMAEDKSRPRYFGFLSFFSFSMTGLVLSNNLLQTFMFWELVGLTSYLLIGFWYEKPEAATAARKAFVINRLGDLGFYLGILLLFLYLGTLSFTRLDSSSIHQSLPAGFPTLLGILVLGGVMGKSAQFPFHNWLPDAMEGPTPVSALIHSATMVAAGVFLLARASALFAASETTLQVILSVGAVTAFLGAAMATIQRDIKKILAYSTISQLGFMVMAAGCAASAASLFHLTTHAFFKSLLFLTAGVFIHNAHSNDIWDIARAGGRKNKLAMGMLALGLLSLGGIPPFAGFFSKDLVLENLKSHSPLFYAVALGVGFLTVYYSGRLFFVLALSKPGGHAHEGHGHSSSSLRLAKALPLLSLAALSLVAGALGSPWNATLLEWLGSHEHPHWNPELVATTLSLSAAAAAVAFWAFRDPEAAERRLQNGRGIVRIVLERKFFVDDAYVFLVKRVGLGLAVVLDWFDRTVINGIMVNQSAISIMRLGRVFSKMQNGSLQDYLAMAVVTGIFVLFAVL